VHRRGRGVLVAAAARGLQCAAVLLRDLALLCREVLGVVERDMGVRELGVLRHATTATRTSGTIAAIVATSPSRRVPSLAASKSTTSGTSSSLSAIHVVRTPSPRIARLPAPDTRSTSPHAAARAGPSTRAGRHARPTTTSSRAGHATRRHAARTRAPRGTAPPRDARDRPPRARCRLEASAPEPRAHDEPPAEDDLVAEGVTFEQRHTRLRDAQRHRAVERALALRQPRERSKAASASNPLTRRNPRRRRSHRRRRNRTTAAARGAAARSPEDDALAPLIADALANIIGDIMTNMGAAAMPMSRRRQPRWRHPPRSYAVRPPRPCGARSSRSRATSGSARRGCSAPFRGRALRRGSRCRG